MSNHQQLEQLFLAIHNGNLLLVKQILLGDPGIDINAKFDLGQGDDIDQTETEQSDTAEPPMSPISPNHTKLPVRHVWPLGRTCLMFAVFSSQHDIVRLLLSSQIGANPNVQDSDGRAALHFAAKNGDLPICHLLIEESGTPCQLELQEKTSGRTALAVAVQNDQFEVARYLISKSADVNATDVSGKSILELVTEKDKEGKMRDLLIGNGAKRNQHGKFNLSKVKAKFRKLKTAFVGDSKPDIPDGTVSKKSTNDSFMTDSGSEHASDYSDYDD